MKKIVVIASGEGSNFSAIVNSGIKVDCVITDNPNANVIVRAEKINVPALVVDKREEYTHGLGWHERTIDENIPEDTDLIVLAGYCRILSPRFCDKWKGKIINVHPSLLPAFAGTCKAIEEAFNYGVKSMGVTIHWVTEEVDGGHIIAQHAFNLIPSDNIETVTRMIHRIEHWLYPQTIKELQS